MSRIVPGERAMGDPVGAVPRGVLLDPPPAAVHSTQPVIAKGCTKEEIIAEILSRKPTPEQIAISERTWESARRWKPEGVCLSEELIQDRRREAERE